MYHELRRPGLIGGEQAWRSTRWIGAGFGLLGLYMVLAGLGWLPANNDPFDLIAGGVLVALVGTAIATWRRGFRLDPGRRRADRITRTLGLRFCRRFPLDRARAVALARRTVRSRNATATAWFVELCGPDDERFELIRFVTREPAHRTAAEVAEALQLPLHAAR